MLNLHICTVIITTKNKNKKKIKRNKNMRFPRFEPGMHGVQSPPRYPLRYGGQCKFQIKIINRIVGKMCNPHQRKSNTLGKHNVAAKSMP